MDILEALRVTIDSVKKWAENKFLAKGELGNFVESVNGQTGNVTINVPQKTSQLTNDSGYMTSYTETDPTVPAWAKQASKPKYTAEEVGAIPNTTTIPTVPTKLSAFDNDKGFITGYTETDPTVPSWAKASSKPTYTASEVGLGNVENVKQYSSSNPPPYPVKSVNGETGAVTLSVLPDVTTSDNGKVLMVVNGAWKAVDLNMSIDANGVISI